MWNKEIMNLADMIKGETNRMCVTHSRAELDAMIIYALKNIARLHDIRSRELMREDEE